MQRTALVVGVANQRSLAWSSALALLRGDFDHVIVTYQNERFQNSIEKMVLKENKDNGLKSGSSTAVPKLISCLSCEVANESEVHSLFDERIPSLLHDRAISLHDRLNLNMNMKLDAMVHCVAYAPADAMKSAFDLPFLNTTKESFEIAHSISSHSLITLSKHALPLLSCEGDDESVERSPSITALTYLGSSRAVQNYNVMGPAKASLEASVRGLALELSPPPHSIRVNAVSAGPVNTLAARGIRNFGEMKHEAEERSFLKRSVTGDEVGNLVEFVAGSRASGVTGQVLFCDGGYSSFGG